MKLDDLARRLRSASRITVLTGSGMSAASGIPTFRGSGGLWRNFRPEDLATPDAFDRDPVTVWEWYDWRRGLIAAARPNRGHEILAAWSIRHPGFTLLTQNVDGLHERAGAAGVVRLHGSIWELRCQAGCGRMPWEDLRAPLPSLPPACPDCGGLARPGVVWFGESLPMDAWGAAAAAVACDVFLAVGTSSLVHPAAGLVQRARAAGAFTAEINLEETPASASFHLSIRGDLQEALGKLEA